MKLNVAAENLARYLLNYLTHFMIKTTQMKKISIWAFALFAIAATMYSCRKNYSAQSGAAEGTAAIAGLLDSVGARPQVFTVTAGVASSKAGAQGTVLNFYPNSFKDANGNIITSGNVTVTVTEMYSAADALANKTSCLSGGELLRSGGQVKITATMNGQTVYANKYGIGFKQTTASSQPMNLFYGAADPGSNGQMVWENGGDTTSRGSTADATVNTTDGTYYFFDSCTHFDFINCDHFAGEGSGNSSYPISVIIADTSFTPTNTVIYLVFPSIKSVISYRSFDYKYWTLDSLYRLEKIAYFPYGDRRPIFPNNLTYKIAAIANKKNQYYYFETSGKVADTSRYQVTFTPKTKEELRVLLKAL